MKPPAPVTATRFEVHVTGIAPVTSGAEDTGESNPGAIPKRFVAVSWCFDPAMDPTTGLFYVRTSHYGTRVHDINRSRVRCLMTGGTPRRIAFTAAGDGIVTNEGGWVDLIK